jgi:polar amino acid transport system substrate-binding protein
MAMNLPERIWRICTLALALCLAGNACPAQTHKLSLTTGALPPLTASAKHPGFLNELAKEAFRRIGVEVEVTAVPTERSLINVNAGLDDGDLFRIAGVEAQYPNVIRVPEKTMDNDFVAYAKRPDVRIRNWADLRPYAVAYTAGWKIYERNVTGVKELTNTPTADELAPLMDKGRVDVILMDRWQGLWSLRQAGYKYTPQEPPLAHVEIFMYLNRKHADLVPKVAQALRDMKADGSYKKIFDATLKPLETR